MIDGDTFTMEQKETGQEGELVRQAPAGYGLMTPQQLASHVRHNQTGMQYSARTNPVTRLEGCDRPGKSEVTPSYGTAGRPLDDKAASIVVTRRDDVEHVFGHGIGPRAESASIRQSWCRMSQTPGILLHISRPNKEDGEVVMHIFANSVSVTDEQTIRFEMCWAGEEAKIPAPASNAELVKHSAEKNLMRLSMVFWREAQLAETGKYKRAARRQRPFFIGMKTSELDAILTRAEGLTNEFERLIYRLSRAEGVSIYRFWPDGNDKQAQTWKDWFTASMTMSALYGNDWHYQCEAQEIWGTDASIHDINADLGQLTMPRNMATQFHVSLAADGTQRQATPSKCNSYKVNADQIFPNAECLAFKLRMAIARDQAFSSAVIASSFQSSYGSISGIFKRHARLAAGKYIVGMSAEGQFITANPSLRPRVGAKLELEIAPTSPGSAPLKFKGAIVDDHFKTGAAAVAFVNGPDLSPSNPDADFCTGVKFMISVKLRDDTTPSERYRAAIEELQTAKERRNSKGVDIQHLVLRAPPSITDTGSLAAELPDYSFFLSIIDKWQPNAEQRKAALQSMASENGVSLIQGPPGTGKSWTGAMIADAHIAAGHHRAGKQNKAVLRRPVLFVAPSNEATDAALDKFRKGSTLSKVEIVRFRASFAHAPKQGHDPDQMMLDDSNVDDDIWDTVEEALWELAEQQNPYGRTDPHAAYSLYRKSNAKFAEWRASRGTAHPHVMAETAMLYQQALDKLCSSSLNRRDRSELNDALTDYTEKLNDYYMQNNVDIVFCTNSSSAHRMLRDRFSPRILITDECAIASVPDAATPMAAFMTSLEHIVMIGDHQQHKPMVSSKGSNEYAEMLERSLFKATYNNPEYESNRTQLVQQRRMHPDLSISISQIFYDGTLTDHPDVSRPSPVWNTLERTLQQLGPAWQSHRRRIVFDAGSDCAIAQKEGHSWINDAEATAVTTFISAATCTKAPPGGESIGLSDFLVISPYSAQVTLIRQKLAQAELSMRDIKVKVTTARGVQGNEGTFVIVSFVRNTPDRPEDFGFIYEKEGLNVMCSRARQALVLIGNFCAWNNAIRNGSRTLNSKSRSIYEHFAKLNADIVARNDLVSPVDFNKAFNEHQLIEQPDISNRLIDVETAARNQAERGNRNNRGRPRSGNSRGSYSNYRTGSTRGANAGSGTTTAGRGGISRFEELERRNRGRRGGGSNARGNYRRG